VSSYGCGADDEENNLKIIAGVIVFQNGIADNKTAKVTSRTFEQVSDLSMDAFHARLPEMTS